MQLCKILGVLLDIVLGWKYHLAALAKNWPEHFVDTACCIFVFFKIRHLTQLNRYIILSFPLSYISVYRSLGCCI